ncbi:hypothetical protein MPSEU_000103000 [Mayamaea pseudoterrestris]|nr:hypothetical protein MPSEU_000103000 [Mayamaea pseudoterrestris]
MKDLASNQDGGYGSALTEATVSERFETRQFASNHSENEISVMAEAHHMFASIQREGSLEQVEEDLVVGLLNDGERRNLSRLAREDSSQQQYPFFHFMFRRMRFLGDYLAYLTLLAMLLIIPVVMYRAIEKQKFDLAAFHSAEIMTLGTVILSARLVYLHLTHWYMPLVQRYVVRILWMVPIYSVQSYLSLRFHESRTYIDCIRDLYEAYVIASFVYYLIQLLGGEEALVQILLRKSDTDLGKHPWPLDQVLYPWELGEEYMLQCKHGVLQYVVFKIMATVVTFVFESMGLYHEGKFDWKTAYPYLCFFQNLSVAYAIYSLVRLYRAVKEELEYPVNWHPLGKFLCIKGVIFFTWWQGVIIFYLRAHGIIEDMGNWTSAEVAYGLIDYCIVIEMVGFAIAHSYTFTYKEYLPENIAQHTGEEIDAGEDLDDAETRRDPSTTWDRVGYHPPATLSSPMDFKDAFWSSAMPRDMRQDIQRLRQEAMTAVRTRNPVSISMAEMIAKVSGEVDVESDDGEELDDSQPVEQSVACQEIDIHSEQGTVQLVEPESTFV